MTEKKNLNGKLSKITLNVNGLNKRGGQSGLKNLIQTYIFYKKLFANIVLWMIQED